MWGVQPCVTGQSYRNGSVVVQQLPEVYAYIVSDETNSDCDLAQGAVDEVYIMATKG